MSIRPLVTMGETMALLTATGEGPLRHQRTLELGTGGAESNVAIGVSRLGVPAAWIGRVGDDEFGRLVLATLRAENIDTGAVCTDPTAPTGLMLKERRTLIDRRVSYYRRGSAGSYLAPEDVSEHVVAGAALLHVTGITPALSPTAHEAVLRAIRIARRHDVPVSFDVNYRSALWSPQEAHSCLLALARDADVLFAGEDEAALLGATGDHAAMAAHLGAFGPTEVVIKRGAHGAYAIADGTVHEVAAVPTTVVDPVGAGDAFVAGYLAERLAGAPVPQRLQTAAICGAAACAVRGDWEGSPRRAELNRLAQLEMEVQR
ncbi:2-dehydro-3-deoxygluconokinase [Streptomyces sp. SLBN-118]|uniref:sugar kinase n=1 Tax=Streptomyces sp. SLBN-118 TaxID=2768454 RepID=UPI00114DD3E5|nr:sugar kinase [Streptomyces sp. SLBN-118]TQK51249.1 2-dehydro-3-deoxygluconokinase [Streptomyces sp. SLBN-118]